MDALNGLVEEWERSVPSKRGIEKTESWQLRRVECIAGLHRFGELVLRSRLRRTEVICLGSIVVAQLRTSRRYVSSLEQRPKKLEGQLMLSLPAINQRLT
jgi:hypothetical protein